MTEERQPRTIDTRSREWWKDYFGPPDGDAAARAKLRRCHSAADAARVDAAIDLTRRLGAARFESPRECARAEAVLNLARVLAHVRADDPRQRPMQAAGWKKFPGSRRESDAGDDRPSLSEARFRRLLETGAGEEQATAFIRLVELLGESVNVAELARDFLDWSDEYRRDRVRMRWAFDYYNAWTSQQYNASTQTDEDTP